MPSHERPQSELPRVINRISIPVSESSPPPVRSITENIHLPDLSAAQEAVNRGKARLEYLNDIRQESGRRRTGMSRRGLHDFYK